MHVNSNAMNALSFMVMTVVISGSLGGFSGYQFYTQPAAAPYVTFPVAPQPQVAFVPPHLPQHYYSAPGNTYSGFSYQTDYPDGGSSQVVFVTGPQSRQLMQQSIESFRQLRPDNAKLAALAIAPNPRPKLRVLTVAPTQENNSTPETATIDVKTVSDSNPTPEPLPNSAPLSLPNTVFSGTPQASVYRVQVFPSHIPQHPQFFHTPFAYHPIFASFYSAAGQINNTSDVLVQQQENANEAQESMVSEVGALPFLASNEIDSTTTTAAPLNSSPEQDTASTQESLSTEAVTTNTPTSEAAVTTGHQDPLGSEIGTTNAQEPSVTETTNADIGNRIQTETSTQVADEEAITTEGVRSTTVAQETTPPAVTTEPLDNSGVNEQTTAEQTTQA